MKMFIVYHQRTAKVKGNIVVAEVDATNKVYLAEIVTQGSPRVFF